MTKDEAADGLSGRILIAMPNIGDPRFDRSVIYMFGHDRAGARGLVVNRIAADISFEELLGQLKIEAGEGAAETPVHVGGPVEVERGFVLHTPDYHRDDATIRVDEHVSMTATVDILHAMAEGRGPERALFALGYAGWGPGQLERELRENVWLHAEADPDLVFDDEDEEKWTRALATIGVSPSVLSSTAGSA